jgi:hypothetical protein
VLGRTNIIVLLLIGFFIAGCSSTKVAIQNAIELKGKRIGIGAIDITAAKKSKRHSTDTVCACTQQSTQQALMPYLQEAGFKVVNLSARSSLDFPQSMRAADSLHLDYVLTGVGLVDIVGSSTFMQQLTIKVVSVNTREIVLSGSFSGTSIRPVKAAGKLGEQIAKKMR